MKTRNPPGRPFQFSLSELVTTVIVVGFLLGLGVTAYEKLHEPNEYMAWIGDQYACVAVVSATQKYVEGHEGAWPTQWADLKVTNHQRLKDRVKIDFAADPGKLAQDDKLLSAAITPVSGSSNLVEGQLEGLKIVLMKYHAPQADETPAFGAAASIDQRPAGN